jgi:NDP-sugar pyrophosphorylase family protein
MKAIILAAGMGKRMRPLTKNLPKPLLTLNNKPLINYTLDLFKKYEINEVKITVFYLKDKIINYLGDGKNFGMKISYLNESELISSSMALKKIEDFVEKNVLIINSDNLTDLNLSKLIDFHNYNKSDMTMVAYLRDSGASPSSVVKFDKSNKIINFIDKCSLEEYKNIMPKQRFANAGIYIFNKKIFREIPPKNNKSIGKLLEELVIKFKCFAYTPSKDEFYKELGKLERYYCTKKNIESGKINLNI